MNLRHAFLSVTVCATLSLTSPAHSATLWWLTNLGNDGVLYGNFDRVRQQKQRIAQELGRRGFTQLRVNDVEIAVTKDACLISIAHLSHPTPNRWWEVIMISCDGNNVDLARTIATQVTNAIRFTW